MPLIQVKKVVAICFLEAAKLTLEHLGAFRLELSQTGVTGPADLPRLYGEVRRLRDFLARCVSAYQDQVDLDLASADAGLLVASCRRAVEFVDLKLTEQALTPDERTWLQRKRQVLGDWAVELAEKPLLDLPLKRLSPVPSVAVRGLTTRLQTKVFGDVRERQKILPPSSTQSIMTGLPSFADQCADIDTTDPQQTMVAPPTVAPPRPPQPATPPPAAAPAAYGLAPDFADHKPLPDVPSGPPLLDHSRLRDPRLRALAGVDLRSYERAVQAADYRLAVVLLASVLESALLDHLLPRRAEFGLTGTPESWNPQDLLLRALGERATPKDRSLAYHLFSARNLLRPALQMVAPAVVTMASFERLREFVGHALHALGFVAVTGTMPPGALRAADFNGPTPGS